MCLLDRGPRRPRSSAIAAPPEADRTGGDTWITPPSLSPDLPSDATREVRHRGRPTLCTDIPSALRPKKPSLRNFAPFMSAPHVKSVVAGWNCERRARDPLPGRVASSPRAREESRARLAQTIDSEGNGEYSHAAHHFAQLPAADVAIWEGSSPHRCGGSTRLGPLWEVRGMRRRSRAGARRNSDYRTFSLKIKCVSVHVDHSRSNASTPSNEFHLSVMRAFPPSLHGSELAKRHPAGRRETGEPRRQSRSLLWQQQQQQQQQQVLQRTKEFRRGENPTYVNDPF